MPFWVWGIPSVHQLQNAVKTAATLAPVKLHVKDPDNKKVLKELLYFITLCH